MDKLRSNIFFYAGIINLLGVGAGVVVYATGLSNVITATQNIDWALVIPVAVGLVSNNFLKKSPKTDKRLQWLARTPAMNQFRVLLFSELIVGSIVILLSTNLNNSIVDSLNLGLTVVYFVFNTYVAWKMLKVSFN